MKKRVIVTFGVVGFVVALGVFGLGFWKNYGHTRVGTELDTAIQIVCFTLCPPSFGLMAGDNSPWPVQAVAMLFTAIENAGLYALLGAVLVWAMEHRGSR
jgi:hypothetical protein